MNEEKPTYEFYGNNYIAQLPPRKSIWKRIKWFYYDIYLGFENRYPICCIWYYTQHTFLGIPVAAYDYVIKGKRHDLGRVVCDKCYLKMKNQ